MKLRRPEVGGSFGPKRAQVGGVRLIARCGQNRERGEIIDGWTVVGGAARWMAT